MLVAFYTCWNTLLVRSHLSFGSEFWAPQGPSADLLRLEGIQRRTTKFILQDYESSYVDRLKKLDLIPISYWREIKDIVFLHKCKSAYMRLTSTSSLPIPPSPPLVLPLVIFVQTCAKPPSDIVRYQIIFFSLHTQI